MRIINIDKALELPQQFHILMEAMEKLYAKRQEEFQKSNPLREIYQMVSLNKFQKSFGSSTGYKQAFEHTVDYAAYPGFTSGDGFKATISYKPFNGKVVVTWQTILEADWSSITDEISDFQIAWQRQVVEYGMYALTAMFGQKKFDKVSKTWMKIVSADTIDGDPMTDIKNPVFTNKHTIVRRDDMTDADFESFKQSNKFYVNVKLDGTDPLAYAKIANALKQIKTRMSKLFDDNGKRAGVSGTKKIVCTEDAQLNSALDSIFAAENFSDATGRTMLNPVKKGFTTYYTPYLDGNIDQPMSQFAVDEDDIAHGFLILDDAYNKANHGPMMVERVPFSLKGVKTDEPEGIKYLGKQAFDFYCPTWRGIAYIYIGDINALYNAHKNDEGKPYEWANPETFTEIKPIAFAKPVSVIGTVTTKAEA